MPIAKNSITLTAFINGNQTQSALLISKDTLPITISISGTAQNAQYTLTADDSVYYNSSFAIPAGNSIFSNATAGQFLVKYTSNRENTMKILSFTVQDNFGNIKSVSDTFNVREGFVANLIPKIATLNIGNIDTILVNVKAIAATGSYLFQLNNLVDSIYYQNNPILIGQPVTLNANGVTNRNGAFDTLIYKAEVPTAGTIGINYTVSNNIVNPIPQTGTVNINLINSTFTPIVKAGATIIPVSARDTVVISMSNSSNANATYSLQLDSSFTYKNTYYPPQSYVKLQNIRGNNGRDTIILMGNTAGKFNPTLTIKNSLPDSNTTVQNIKLLGNVSSYYYFLAGTNASSISMYALSADGVNWSTPRVFNANLTSTVTGVAFSTNLNGIAITSDGSYMRTQDGGITWSSPTSIGSNINSGLLVKFSTAATGVIVGVNTNNFFYSYLYTLDSGRTWSTPLQAVTAPNDIAFSSATTGIIGNNNAQYVYTSDGGRTWTRNNAPVANAITSIAFAPAKTATGKLYGTMTFANAFTAYSLDSGLTWKLVYIDPPINYATSAAGYSSPTNVAFIGYNGTLSSYYFATSTNGGSSYNFSTGQNLGSFNSNNFRSLTFIAQTTAESSNNGILLNTYSNQYGITSDGGASYNFMASPFTTNNWLTVNKNIVWQ
ncbi:MAG: hypothetical protein QM528_08930 [Phycisphaerales bacterium]|nr:hypothetical protein [Phycisphaerales bacterium]